MSQKEDALLPASMRRGAVAMLLIGALFSGSAAPLAAGVLARFGCHCPVPMQCCQRDMCTMDGDAAYGARTLSSCDRALQDALPVPATILAIVPAHFVLEVPTDRSEVVVFEAVRPGEAALSSDSPPPRDLLFS